MTTCITASIFDLRSRRIPNWLIILNLPILIKLDWTIFTIIALAIVASFIFGKYVGGGDFKLAALIAIYVHILSWSQYWLYISLVIGALFGLIFRKKSLPFAPFLTLGLISIYVAQELLVI